VPGLDPSAFNEAMEPARGGVASPAGGGGGAGFFFGSDWTRASQGGSLDLGVSIDWLEMTQDTQNSTQKGVFGGVSHREENTNTQQNTERCVHGERSACSTGHDDNTVQNGDIQ